MKKPENVLKKRTGLKNLPGRVKKTVKVLESVRRNRKRLVIAAKGISKLTRNFRKKRRAYG